MASQLPALPSYGADGAGGPAAGGPATQHPGAGITSAATASSTRLTEMPQMLQPATAAAGGQAAPPSLQTPPMAGPPQCNTQAPVGFVQLPPGSFQMGAQLASPANCAFPAQQLQQVQHQALPPMMFGLQVGRVIAGATARLLFWGGFPFLLV